MEKWFIEIEDESASVYVMFTYGINQSARRPRCKVEKSQIWVKRRIGRVWTPIKIYSLGSSKEMKGKEMAYVKEKYIKHAGSQREWCKAF